MDKTPREILNACHDKVVVVHYDVMTAFDSDFMDSQDFDFDDELNSYFLPRTINSSQFIEEKRTKHVSGITDNGITIITPEFASEHCSNVEIGCRRFSLQVISEGFVIEPGENGLFEFLWGSNAPQPSFPENFTCRNLDDYPSLTMSFSFGR